MTFDFSKKSSLLILDLINAKANRPLTIGEIVLASPTVADDETRNTELVISPIPNHPTLVNDAVLKYNRIPLETLFDGFEAYTQIEDSEELTEYLVLETLNSRFGLGLSEEDFVFPMEKIDSTLTLTAKPDGVVYTGVLVLKLTGVKEQLDILMGDGILDGFVPPTFEIDDTGYEVRVNVEPTKLSAAGYIYYDVNANRNPSRFCSTTDGTLEMNLRAVRGAIVYTPVEPGVYTLKLTSSQPWSVSMDLNIPEEMGNITDNYELSLYSICRDDGNSFNVPIYDTTDPRYSPNNPNVLGGFVKDIKSNYYNQTNIRDIAGYVDTGTNTRPYYGTFDIKLTAIPKTGLGKPVTLTITVIATT